MDQANDDFLVLGIAYDNTTAHIHDSARNPLQKRMNFFDSQGFRQVLMTDPDTGKISFERTGLADPDLVMSRLNTVLQHFAEWIASRANELEAAGVSSDEALSSLPDLTGRTLDDAIKACFDLLGHPQHNVGLPLHNIIVHGIFG